MLHLCLELKQHADDVIALWESLAVSEPWLLLPQQDRVDHLPDVIRAISDAALCTAGATVPLRELTDLCVVHGLHRAEQGVPDHVIPMEYDLLRRATWIFLRRHSKVAEGQTDVTAILRVDAAISVAMRAAIIGYHRPQLELSGRWPSAIEDLAAESPLGWVEKT